MGRALPRSRFVPGLVPHAEKPVDLGAHSNWNGTEKTLVLDPDYLWGIDLFNYGFYWEAHEVWEGLWRQAGNGTASRFLLQALIQAAASMLKALCEQWAACQTLGDKAFAKCTKAQELGGPRVGGLDVAGFGAAICDYALARNSAIPVPRLLLKPAR